MSAASALCTGSTRLLLSDAANARLSTALAELGDAVEVVTIGTQGEIAGTDGPVDIAYLSADLLRAQQLPQVTARMVGGWAHSCAAGTDGAGFTALMASGVQLTRSDAQAPAIADYVLCQTLGLLHPIAEARAAQLAGDWRRLPFREIGDTHWLIVGFGAIGQAITRRLRGFGAAVTAIRRDPTPDPLADHILPPAKLLNALPHADVVVLACPLTDETRGVADARFFAALKPGAILVNVGRGALIDDAALLAGLDIGQPATALLDVFNHEPLPETSPFWTHPAVHITAHGAGAGSGVEVRNDACFLDNLHRYLTGSPLIGIVAPPPAKSLQARSL